MRRGSGIDVPAGDMTRLDLPGAMMTRPPACDWERYQPVLAALIAQDAGMARMESTVSVLPYSMSAAI